MSSNNKVDWLSLAGSICNPQVENKKEEEKMCPYCKTVDQKKVIDGMQICNVCGYVYNGGMSV